MSVEQKPHSEPGEAGAATPLGTRDQACRLPPRVSSPDDIAALNRALDGHAIIEQFSNHYTITFPDGSQYLNVSQLKLERVGDEVRLSPYWLLGYA